MEKVAEVVTDTDTTDNNLSTVREQETANRHGGEQRSGLSAGQKASEKQEWAFTLYDLDGQGRVTKDEVAQLLKSLYDSVGSSISLPQTGTKSLKLLLTVTPDQTVEAQNKVEPDPELPRDLNCKECNSDKDKMHCPKKDINSKLNNGAFVKLIPKDTTKDSSATISVQNNLSKAHRDKHVHSAVKRMSAIEQRQLAELVKFNMDKNKEKKSRHTESSRQRSSKNRQSLHLSHMLENPDRRNYYLDLAGIDNPSSLTLPVSPIAKDDANARSQHRQRKSKSSSQRRNANVDKSSGQVHFSRDLFDHDGGEPDNHENSSPIRHSTPAKTSTPQGAMASGQKTTSTKTKTTTSHHKRGVGLSSPTKQFCSKSFGKKDRPVTIAPDERNDAEQQRARERTAEQCTASAERSTETPKHRRQKQHREKNHLRAMMQVAQWIEKEHAGESLGDLSVEKHEHQHFHEHHHHHHYHHYYQT